MGSVVFRVETGVGVGLGHVQRCLSLALALREAGHTSHFVVSGGAAARARFERLGFTFSDLGAVPPGSDGDSRAVLDQIERRVSGAVVVDSYLVDGAYIDRLRLSTAALVAIDDLVGVPPPAHIIVNAAVGVEAAAYAGLDEGTQLLLGPAYALLGPEYWDTRPRVVEEVVERVLVTMGGADGQNLTPLVLAGFDSFRGSFAVDVVIGPYNAHRAEVEEAVCQLDRPARLLSGEESLAELMAAADVTVSAGGQTLYELAATGAPAVAVQVNENQASVVAGLAERGCVDPLILRDRDRIGPEVAGKVAALNADRGRRHKMSLAGRRLVDGQGARRVAKAIASLL
jgi:UDP-2,4-diacetamido-2,4,6-trideoxy-beta-L-altropyranose hydrolase